MRSRPALKLLLCVLAVVVAALVAVLGRAENPASLLHRITSSSAHSKVMYVDFVSVVNLPLGAPVLARGAQIGTVEAIELVPGAARLSLGVDPAAYLPAGTTAELRQLTILGDIYVALTPPAGASGPSLGAGAVIGLADSDPGPQIEDILTNLADFMAGGALLRVQDAARQVNESVAVDGLDMRSVARTGALAIDDLAAGTAQLDAMVGSLEEATSTIISNPGELGYAFGPAGHSGLRAVFDAVNEGFKLVAGSSELAFGLNWLTPRLAQLNPFMEQLVPLLRSYSAHSTEVNGNLGAIGALAQDKLIPFAQHGAISIEEVTLHGDEKTRSVAAVLRMIGALR